VCIIFDVYNQFHIRNNNLDLKNWSSVVYLRRTENKGISILLLVDIETFMIFVKSHSKSNNRYKQDEIIQMLGVMIDNIFVFII
jgi:hypothetical protein